ncbi:MAG: hypothetical protein QOF87_1253 [Pseudonocardiales bacterium]|nr:hypothetical protein [Pseudonocardiales bacterium]
MSITTLGLVLAAVGLALGGATAQLRPSRASAVQAVAGGLLLSLVAFDLLPDAVGDGREVGLARWVITTVALTAFAVVTAAMSRIAAPDTVGCCATPVGRMAAIALVAHGMAEGAVLGLSSGLATHTGPLLLIAFCLHKAGEGLAIASSVRNGSHRRRRVVGWLTLAALAPVAGALLAQHVNLAGGRLPLTTAAVAGVLGAVALRLLRPALASESHRPRAFAVSGLVAMTAIIGVGA